MAIDKTKTHSVGNINSAHIVTIPEVFAGEDLENYSLVELDHEDGKRVAKYSTGEGKQYLLAAVEYMYEGEDYIHFFPGKDEGVRVVHLEQGFRFETSNFDIENPERGQKVAWDADSKKFALATEDSTGTVFEVVNNSGTANFGVPLVRLEVQ
ncbi:hypothetical protein [Shouchella clausii]|uniref:hypothetical protein n=1 Tax=Shouchella clausii TaxID=79880 RepID=UPI001C73D613|nr:hypothetical protein [Shouchella clausii]MBX0320188.1 hypothetical protein [Shouchella clausii]